MTDRSHDNNSNPNTTLEDRIARTLDDACDRFDPKVRQRLNLMRTQVLNSSTVSAAPRWQPGSWRLIAAAFATATVALAVAIGLVEPNPQADPPPMTADLDLLTDPRFELLIEDPEFIAWIVETEALASPTENPG